MHSWERLLPELHHTSGTDAARHKSCWHDAACRNTASAWESSSVIEEGISTAPLTALNVFAKLLKGGRNATPGQEGCLPVPAQRGLGVVDVACRILHQICNTEAWRSVHASTRGVLSLPAPLGPGIQSTCWPKRITESASSVSWGGYQYLRVQRDSRHGLVPKGPSCSRMCG